MTRSRKSKKTWNRETHQLVNLSIIQADNIIFRGAVREHQRVRLDLALAGAILGALTAGKPVERARVVGPGVDGHAHPALAPELGQPLGRPAAAVGEALGVDVPVGRDAAIGDGRGVAGAAEVWVDVGADRCGAGAVVGVVEVGVDRGDGGDEAQEDSGDLHVGLRIDELRMS